MNDLMTNFEKSVLDFQRNNFDRRYSGVSMSSVQLPIWAMKNIENYMREPKNMLIFLSKPGIGKTHLCSAMCNWALEKFRYVRYHREYDLLTKLRQGISEGTGDYLKALEYLTDDDLIMLDDVGSGINPNKNSHRDLEWRREVFFSFLDQRYNSMKPTIITSNFSRRDFTDVFSERVSSRLFASENTIIEIFDDSTQDKRSLKKYGL
jgi:DNA replication protein DnaC